MEQRVSLVTRGVSDLARSRAFYEALGWKVALSPATTFCDARSLNRVTPMS